MAGTLGAAPLASHEKRAPGWLDYIGDEILPSYYIGILINDYKDAGINEPVFHGK